ncbi:aromatic ring-hydroxylating dioxygenase subunit alpha [Phenylobacterium sp.]|uniref:aromatic ring-hydroxylating oxygenase subunit alpha n=1 Tax=Phenylobacterium sp. TaxID=1871053 RepID=UPI0025F3CA2D|nr:SRPBCC family protein [Phenylobacterium sp.]MBX3482032.1 Rieske 2Fe-2S domain-containing protein [Phenylobacterium sp.]MCW5760041.1 Rieske 2Fe-2S domain-containing protein [Phenylobacterium sp.]
MTSLMTEPEIVERVFAHIDGQATDLSEGPWREPVANYLSQARFEAEVQVMRRTPTPFCPSAAIPTPGAYLARTAAQTPILVVRGADGVARAYRNACRHRGAEVACGMGRQKSFACPYHGWTYGLDGALRGLPGEHGFPGLDKAAHGLRPLRTQERAGLVFVTQEPGPSTDAGLDEPPAMFPEGMAFLSATERDVAANWKISAEGFLEGYHIRQTHRQSFYPLQYDNLNVVEAFGRNSRVTFPYQNIEKQRDFPPATRRAAGRSTFVYHLFPNVMIATLPKRVLMVVLEPVSPGVTRDVRYMLAEPEALATSRARIDQAIALDHEGAREDREIVESIQRGLASGANDAFEFGLFEGAIAHFHRNLHAAIGAAA